MKHSDTPQCSRRSLISRWIAPVLPIVVLALVLPTIAEAELRSVGASFCQSSQGCMSAAEDSSGRTYVLDRGLRRVYLVSPQGALIRTLTGSTGVGAFANPIQVIVDGSDNVYVADNGGPVQEFDSSGQYVRKFANGGARSLALDAVGNLYHVNSAGQGVSKFSPSGTLDEGWAPGLGGNLWGVAFNAADGHLYVTDAQGRQVFRVNTDTAEATHWGQVGADDGDFPNEIAGIATDSDGNVYVSDYGTRIQKFTKEGRYLGKWSPSATLQLDIRGTHLLVGRNADAAVLDLDAPIAAVTAMNPAPRVGESVVLSAGASEMPFGSISKYEWDLDGDGTFERSTEAASSVSSVFPTTGAHIIRVRVTGGTSSSVARATVDVQPATPDPVDGQPGDPPGTGSPVSPPTPPTGRVGVSINGGALFTNNPLVSVRIVWPLGAATALLSNDGGFGGTTPIAVAASIPWRLASSGPERLPKTVYVRYDSSGAQTFSDDIILDETPPRIASVALTGTAKAASTTAAAARKRTYRIRIKATDPTSGVVSAQFAVRRNRPSARVAYRSRLRVRGVRPKYVRVRDRAGNPSRWHRLR